MKRGQLLIGLGQGFVGPIGGAVAIRVQDDRRIPEHMALDGIHIELDGMQRRMKARSARPVLGLDILPGLILLGILLELRQGLQPRLAEPLTPRQQEVLRLIADGRSTKEVATTLNISIKTAEAHRANIMERLKIRDVAGLVRYALRTGLVEA